MWSRTTSNLLKINKNTGIFRRVHNGAPQKKPITIIGDSATITVTNAEPKSPRSLNYRRMLSDAIQGAVLAVGWMTVGCITLVYSSTKIEKLMKILQETIDTPVGDDEALTKPTSKKLLPDLHSAEKQVFTLVIDLNETLLYSDWKHQSKLIFIRPGVDEFLEHLSKYYEIVVYSDTLQTHVNHVCERLDKLHYIRHKLSLRATKYQDGKFKRDLSRLNRDPAKIIYVSGDAFEPCLQPENCVPIKSGDTTLVDLIPFLEYVAKKNPADVRTLLASYERKDIAKEFLEEHHQR